MNTIHMYQDNFNTVAQERFGIPYLFPYQRLVISNILEAVEYSKEKNNSSDNQSDVYNHQIVILPTGAGKSLCFQLPAALINGATLIVYPLLSLMNDQERRIQASGFHAVQLKGGQDRKEREKILQDISCSKVDFILTNPETLQSPAIISKLRKARIIHAVIDEAHCISEWGNSFRPVYLQLGKALADMHIPICTAFTATASDTVIKQIKSTIFPDTGAHLIRGNPDRENISYSIVPCLSRLHALISMAQKTTTGFIESNPSFTETSASSVYPIPVWQPELPIALPAIIFCQTRNDTQRYARYLGSIIGKDKAAFYHAGLSPEQKKSTESIFFDANDMILCATCAYGMGVDKPNIRTVIHSYIPSTVEAFLQESGRGGRDRQASFSIVLVSPNDQMQYMLAEKPAITQQMVFGNHCRREILLQAMGMESEACAGCDRCISSETPAISKAAHMLTMVMKSVPHLSKEDIIPLLRGRISWEQQLRGFQHITGYSSFSHWSEAALEAAIDDMQALQSCTVPSAQHESNTLPFPISIPQRRPLFQLSQNIAALLQKRHMERERGMIQRVTGS